VDPDTPDSDGGTLLMERAADKRPGTYSAPAGTWGRRQRSKRAWGNRVQLRLCQQQTPRRSAVAFRQRSRHQYRGRRWWLTAGLDGLLSSPEFREWLTSVGGKRHDNGYAPWPWPPHCQKQAYSVEPLVCSQ